LSYAKTRLSKPNGFGRVTNVELADSKGPSVTEPKSRVEKAKIVKMKTPTIILFNILDSLKMIKQNLEKPYKPKSKIELLPYLRNATAKSYKDKTETEKSTPFVCPV
jgi:hypothetical protein